MRHPWLLPLLLLTTPRLTRAESYAPPSSTSLARIAVQPGRPEHVVAIGPDVSWVRSVDGGLTWRWGCRDGGVPSGLAITPTGAVLVATDTGLQVSRDGCGFEAVFRRVVEALLVRDDGHIFIAAGDRSIHRSTDDGRTFTEVSLPGLPGDRWTGLVAAPSRPGRLFLSGDGLGQAVLLRSDDDGATFVPARIPSASPVISAARVLGVAADDPDVVFLADTSLDGWGRLFRSGDGGDTWQATTIGNFVKLLAMSSAPGGTVRVGAADGLYDSEDGGRTFTHDASGSETHISYAISGTRWWSTVVTYTQRDSAILAKDGTQQWQSMLRLHDLAGPIECASGTYQADVCVDRLWCGVRATFEVAVEDPSCPAPPPPGALDAGAGPQPPTGGCAVGAGTGPGLMVGLLALAWRRRRGRPAR